MKKKLVEIMDLAVVISNDTKVDVFVWYSGHVHAISVRVFDDGWKEGSEPTIEWNLYLEWEKEAEKLDEILVYLKKIMDKNTLIEDLEDNISDLETEKNELQEKIDDLENELNEIANERAWQNESI